MDNYGPYPYRVFWSFEDKEWVGTHLEYPSLSCLAPTKKKAHIGIIRLVREARNEAVINTNLVSLARAMNVLGKKAEDWITSEQVAGNLRFSHQSPYWKEYCLASFAFSDAVARVK